MAAMSGSGRGWMGMGWGDQSNGSIGQDATVTVTAHSIGVDLPDGWMTVIIPKNTRIPVKVKKYFATLVDNQTRFAFPIFQGEDPKTENNTSRGLISVGGIPPAPAGKYSVWISMEVEVTAMGDMGVLRIEAGRDGAGGEVCMAIPVEVDKQKMSEQTETNGRLMLGKDTW